MRQRVSEPNRQRLGRWTLISRPWTEIGLHSARSSFQRLIPIFLRFASPLVSVVGTQSWYCQVLARSIIVAQLTFSQSTYSTQSTRHCDKINNNTYATCLGSDSSASSSDLTNTSPRFDLLQNHQELATCKDDWHSISGSERYGAARPSGLRSSSWTIIATVIGG